MVTWDRLHPLTSTSLLAVTKLIPVVRVQLLCEHLQRLVSSLENATSRAQETADDSQTLRKDYGLHVETTADEVTLGEGLELSDQGGIEKEHVDAFDSAELSTPRNMYEGSTNAYGSDR